MFSALSHCWQRLKHSGRASRPLPSSRHAFRPSLEALEDRCVPAIWFVNSNADDIMQGGTLRWAAAHAQNGDTIEILPTDNGAGRHIVLTHGELLLNQEVTIEAVGPAATIDGNNSSRIFEVSPRASVTLDNLFIVNGDAKAHAGFIANLDGDGGAILNEGWLTLDTCVVENNGTNGDGRVNVAVKKGGGIYDYPNAFLDLTRSRVEQNFADIAGGGIYNNRATAIMDHMIMRNNSTNGDGGAIYNAAGTVQVDLFSVLLLNRAQKGGAIATVDGNVEVSDTLLADNTASVVGGAVYDQDSWVNIQFGCTLKDNHAVKAGGGIYNLAGALYVTSSSLIHNTTDGNGGGIDSFAGLVVNILDCHLDKNSAGGVGGGIYDYFSTVTVSNSHLDFNSALAGGGFYHQGGVLTVTDSDVVGNSASFFGGGIAVVQGVVQVTGSQLILNSAPVGGGIFNSLGTLKVGTTQFTGNTPDNINGSFIDLGGNTFM